MQDTAAAAEAVLDSDFVKDGISHAIYPLEEREREREQLRRVQGPRVKK